jgi:hypothetical protein
MNRDSARSAAMSLAYRCDSRSVETTAHNIKDYTTREVIMQPIIQAEFESRGFPCRIEHYGVDNTGELITGSLPNDNPDIKVVFNDGGVEELVDIVHGGDVLRSTGSVKTPAGNLQTWNVCTFKLSKIDSCIKHNSFLLAYRYAEYYVFTVEAMKEWVAKFKPQIHKSFCDKKLSCRGSWAAANEFVSRGLAERHDWSPKAKAMIDAAAHELFRSKRKDEE